MKNNILKQVINNVNSQYGAPMGRRDIKGDPADKSVHVFHVPINSGGYDCGGAYWGLGDKLYCATDCEEYRQFTRAKNRKQAIELLDIDPILLIRK